jgi:cell division septation protein DedD
MFVEEGFRIRFANGEVIDFYADNAESKAGWMSVLTDCVGKDVAGNNRGWASMVLDKERRDRARSQVAPPLRQAKPPRESMGNDRPRTQPSQAVQSSPVKSRPSHGRTKSHIPSTAAPPPPVEKDARHKPAPPPAPRTRDAAPAKTNRRDQVRSMIF